MQDHIAANEVVRAANIHDAAIWFARQGAGGRHPGAQTRGETREDRCSNGIGVVSENGK